MVKKAAQATPNHLLRAARKQRGWTQKTVADRIGAPLSLNVTRWEGGTAFPSAYYIEKLCLLFEKSAKDLGLLQHELDTRDASAPPQAASLWNVPFRRNPFFTGRADLLHSLRNQLTREHSAAITQSQALSGLGGIGKTQTAVEYSYRYRQAYHAVFWVRAASRDTLITDFVEIAGLLELPGQDAKDQTAVVVAVKHWLAQQTGWLLILDNADDLALVADFLPTGEDGHILLTTRAQATGKIASSIAVEKMEPDEGALLLLRRIRLLPLDAPLHQASAAARSQAQAIVAALDGLPLALDQAGAYIEETGCCLSDYLQLYHARKTALLNRQSSVSPEYPYTVAKTWSLSFLRVEQDNPAAADLLRLCAFLDPDLIAEGIITQAASLLGPVLGPVAADPLLWHEAIGVLRSFSLVRRDPEAKVLNLHRLVQTVLKDGMDPQM